MIVTKMYAWLGEFGLLENDAIRWTCSDYGNIL